VIVDIVQIFRRLRQGRARHDEKDDFVFGHAADRGRVLATRAIARLRGALDPSKSGPLNGRLAEPQTFFLFQFGVLPPGADRRAGLGAGGAGGGGKAEAKAKNCGFRRHNLPPLLRGSIR
jgi:hypothetical protein